MNFIKHVATAALLVALSASASVFADTVKTNTGNIDTIFNEKAFKNIPQNSQEVKRFVVPTNGIIALEIDGKVNVIEVRTYQALEYHKLHNTKNQIDLSK